MYHAAAQLTPDEVYDVARMAFLEMLFAGTTTVGEFHYLHTDPTGRPYEDPNLLSKQVIAAAASVGIRIVLLRTAYLRSGFELPRDPGPDPLLRNDQRLSQQHAGARRRVSARPASALRRTAFARCRWPISKRSPPGPPRHSSRYICTSPSRSPRTPPACASTAARPSQLLGRNGILSGPIHRDPFHPHATIDEIAQLAEAQATICSCPTTERNLGDGILAADQVMASGIRVALGSDSQAQIDPLEDARELDYHLRSARSTARHPRPHRRDADRRAAVLLRHS